MEEPIQVEGSNDALEWLSDRTSVPLCMGERNFTKWGFQDIIAKRLVSYLNPDIVHCGGISEFKEDRGLGGGAVHSRSLLTSPTAGSASPPRSTWA